MFQHHIAVMKASIIIVSLGFMVTLWPVGLTATPVQKPVTTSKATQHYRTNATRPAPVHKAGTVKHDFTKKPAAAVKATPVQTPIPNAFMTFFKTGKQAFEAGRYAEAEVNLKKSLATGLQVMPPKHPNIGLLHNFLGLIQMRRHNYAAATDSLKEAVSIYGLREDEPERRRFLLNDYLLMGQMAMYDGRFPEARQYYPSALPLAEALGEPEKLQGVQQVLEDIARIDSGPDYMKQFSQKITRWSHPEQPIHVYIADGANFTDWRAENRSVVQEAFGEWQQAMGARLRFAFVEEPEAADIQVSWMNVPKSNSAEGRFSSQSELRHGICETQAMNHFLIKDDIRIALHNTDGAAFSKDFLHNTLLHEIAHAIGLINGHSPTPGDALYPNTRYEDGRRKHLTARDIATAQKLYDLPAQVTNPAGIHLVRFNQFANIRVKAAQAYNGGDYPAAFNQFQQALSIYPVDADSQFWAAMSAWKLKQYEAALPRFISASNLPGQYQGEALRMAGSSIILSAQHEDQSGNLALAEGKYRQAQDLLNQGLPRIPLKPEEAKAIQDTLAWLNQRLAMRSVIRWASDTSSADSQNRSSADSGKKKRKRGWFSALFEPSTGTSRVPVNIMMPAHMMGY